MKSVLLGWAISNLIGGQPANPSEFPASVYTTQGNSRCSATVIGPQTLLIAAHCVDSVKTPRFRAGISQYEAVCEIAPEYEKNETSDWALCHIDSPVEGIAYESLNKVEVKVGDELLLSGYGCVKPGGGGGNDGIYRIAKVKVQSVPHGTSNDIVTKGSAALCFGDSGGPVFKEFGKGQRVVVGVNSRGNIKDTSYLVSVASAEFKKFLAEWSEKHSEKVCGYGAEGCRF